MQIFLSWSGEQSKDIAMALRDWLPEVVNNITPWMSRIDIDAGSNWLNNIGRQLQETNYGIICLTEEAIYSPWLLYETGALSKFVDKSFVCPYLIDLVEIPEGPLQQFQAVCSDKNGTWELVQSISRVQNQSLNDKHQLDRQFTRCWPELMAKINDIQRQHKNDYKNLIVKTLNGIIKGTKKGLSISNANFQSQILKNLQDYSGRVAEWENGAIYIQPENGVEFLVDLYNSARKNVFSTSVQGFFSTMINDLASNKLLEANKNNPAKCTRVFIFDTRKEITSSDIDIMRTNKEFGIEVLVYVDSENPQWTFPTDVSRDFTIIDDGEAIGVSECIDRHRTAARWYFDNNARKSQFRRIKDALVRGSHRFDDFQSVE